MAAAAPGTQLIGDPSMLVALARMAMPFGRYRGRRLIDLPEPYVVWFKQHTMPSGRLGDLLGLLYEVKVNGLEHLVRRAAASAPHAAQDGSSHSAPTVSRRARPAAPRRP